MSEMTRNRIDGWGIYLALVVCLIPVVVPSGPARLAFVDGLIVLGLGAFAVLFLTRKEPVRVPFLAPVIMIAVGSLAAMVNAESPSAAFLAMAQDAYLFLWFIMLVQILRDRDLTVIQGTWIAAATVVALYGIFIVITEGHLSPMDIVKPTGKRAYGTFYDPNMFAGYLVMSLFFVLGMGRRLPWWVRWGSMLTMLVSIVATKSLGGTLSLVVGLGVWLLMRAWTRNVRPAAVVACALLVASLGLAALWMNAGVGIGAAQLSVFESHSFLARAGHSSEGRFTIWKNLQATWAKSPLGIGPGNSTYLTLAVEDRLRPNSLQSKEAHNDYLAYAIERGPLGLLGLLVLLGSAFGKLGAIANRGTEAQATRDRDGPMVAALTGALAASAVHALTIEVLHFRHFWMLMAIICAIDARATAGQTDRRPSTQGDSTWPRQSPVAA